VDLRRHVVLNIVSKSSNVNGGFRTHKDVVFSGAVITRQGYETSPGRIPSKCHTDGQGVSGFFHRFQEHFGLVPSRRHSRSLDFAWDRKTARTRTLWKLFVGEKLNAWRDRRTSPASVSQRAGTRLSTATNISRHEHGSDERNQGAIGRTIIDQTNCTRRNANV